MAAIIVKLECISNLHVGSGDTNYNIVDKEVERDPVTNYPTINASGVKGALREYFNTSSKLPADIINKIFGADVAAEASAGLLKFFSADMLALAVRASKGDEPYHLVTTDAALGKLKDNHKIFLGKELDVITTPVLCTVEEISLKNSAKVLGHTLYPMDGETFRSLSLPVMTRNYLVNGISKNLWYEELVPHESIFTFVVYSNDCNSDLLDTFAQTVQGKIIQFGANASIGYGFCKVSVVG